MIDPTERSERRPDAPGIAAAIPLQIPESARQRNLSARNCFHALRHRIPHHPPITYPFITRAAESGRVKFPAPHRTLPPMPRPAAYSRSANAPNFNRHR